MMKLFTRVFFFVLIMIPLFGLLEFVFSPFDRLSCFINPLPLTRESISNILKFKWQKTGLITIWFDDASKSYYTENAIALMRKQGFVGTISVATDLVCKTHYMTWSQLRKLQRNGWEITSLAPAAICEPKQYFEPNNSDDFLNSKQTLLSQGLRADHFAVSCDLKGSTTSKVCKFIRPNYSSCRTTGKYLNKLPIKDPYSLTAYTVTNNTSLLEIENWIDRAAMNKSWLILVFPRFDNPKIYSGMTLDKFNSILSLIKYSKLPVVLPSQVLAIKNAQ